MRDTFNYSSGNLKIKYLIQGREKEVIKLRNLFKNRDISILTWDQPAAGCVYLPKSSWSEGRRRLLELTSIQEYDYIAFVDGDVDFNHELLPLFEKKIALLRPAVAIPLYDKIKWRYSGILKKFKTALIFESDEQFQVIGVNELFNYFHLNPYISDFDNLSWWYPCIVIQSFVSRNLWRRSIVDIEFTVSNSHDAEYPNNFNARYISDFLSSYGMSTYFPLSINGKNLLRNASLIIPVLFIDKIILFASCLLFPFIYVPNYLPASDRAKRESMVFKLSK